MKRRNFIRNSAFAAGSLLINPTDLFAGIDPTMLKASDFGPDFKFGVATAAYQIEGAWNLDGKSPSIWDHMCHSKPNKIKNKQNADSSCDFYHRYEKDLEILKFLNFKVFRFSIAWTRILPNGIGTINQKGLEFYHKVIDKCLELDIEPWITLYHWDLPQVLEDKGGWANRDMLDWFSAYTELLTKEYGNKVKNWMVLNEPAAYTAVGYLAGMHAPGYIAPKKFLAAAHHATMIQGIAGRIIRKNIPEANIGTTFSCSVVQPKKKGHEKAAFRGNILLNRLFIEPLLGMGYPTKDYKFIQGIEKFIQEGDMEKAAFDMDFIGLQNYTRFVFSKAIIPFVWMNEVKPIKRGVSETNITKMGWEVYPEGIYEIIKQFASYEKVPPIIITENGAAFQDKVENGKVHDEQRTAFYKKYLQQVLKAKNEGIDIRGYFAWTFLDNFEWAEGFDPRFGLVHVDYKSKERTIKDSGYWFRDFLSR